MGWRCEATDLPGSGQHGEREHEDQRSRGDQPALGPSQCPAERHRPCKDQREQPASKSVDIFPWDQPMASQQAEGLLQILMRLIGPIGGIESDLA